jgi:hypothetical protein
MVLPEDLQAVLPAVVGHRLQPAADVAVPLETREGIERMLAAVAVP